MPLNKLTKLSFKTRKCKSDQTESDLTEEKLIMVDNGGVADLTGAAGVSKYDEVPTCGTFPPPTINNPASTINFIATAANKSTQVMSTNPIDISLAKNLQTSLQHINANQDEEGIYFLKQVWPAKYKLIICFLFLFF